MRLPPTPCRVCFRPCVFNKFSHFWQKKNVLYFIDRGLSRSASWSATWHMGLQALARSELQALAWGGTRQALL